MRKQRTIFIPIIVTLSETWLKNIVKVPYQWNKHLSCLQKYDKSSKICTKRSLSETKATATSKKNSEIPPTLSCQDQWSSTCVLFIRIFSGSSAFVHCSDFSSADFKQVIFEWSKQPFIVILQSNCSVEFRKILRKISVTKSFSSERHSLNYHTFSKV